MIEPLQSRLLFTLTLQVAFGAMLDIGTSVIGRRRIAPVTSGSFEGERLRGTVLPGGADWVVNRPDGVMAVDVRLALKTDDGAAIYCSYQGLFRAEAEAMTRFNRGGQLTIDEYMLRTVVRMETGADAYRWLNDVLAVARGRQTPTGPIYDVFEVL